MARRLFIPIPEIEDFRKELNDIGERQEVGNDSTSEMSEALHKGRSVCRWFSASTTGRPRLGSPVGIGDEDSEHVLGGGISHNLPLERDEPGGVLHEVAT